MDLNNLKNLIEQEKGRRLSCIDDIKKTKARLKDELKRTRAAEESRTILQTVAKKVQSKLEYKISELATLSLQAIMEKDWKVIVEFQEKRNKTEPYFLLDIGNGNISSTKNSFGGGVKDILGQFLRFGLFAIIRPKLRPFFALDEPLKWLKGDGMPEKGAVAIHEVSHKLGYQILVISHSPELIEGADKIIEIKGG